MTDERKAFSRRLKDAMMKAGYEARPTVLLKLFNSRYHGPSVSFQSVSRWLGGKAIPEQDKLQVLSMLFGIEPYILRYGQVSPEIGEGSERLLTGAGVRERQIIQAFLALSPRQRELVGALVDALLGVE